jgi:hypothetical protein
MKVIWPVIFACLCAVIYSIIVYIKAPSEAWGWWHSLVSTIVAVLLGVSIAIFLFQNEQHTNSKNDKQRYLSLMRLELSGVRQRLLDPTRITLSVYSGEILQAQVTYIQPLIMEEAGRSGLFKDNASFMMLDLSGSMRMFSKKTDILINLLSLSKEPIGLEKNIRSAILNIDQSRNGILRGIELLSKELDIDLTDKILKY